MYYPRDVYALAETLQLLTGRPAMDLIRSAGSEIHSTNSDRLYRKLREGEREFRAGIVPAWFPEAVVVAAGSIELRSVSEEADWM